MACPYKREKWPTKGIKKGKKEEKQEKYRAAQSVRPQRKKAKLAAAVTEQRRRREGEEILGWVPAWSRGAHAVRLLWNLVEHLLIVNAGGPRYKLRQPLPLSAMVSHTSASLLLAHFLLLFISNLSVMTSSWFSKGSVT